MDIVHLSFIIIIKKIYTYTQKKSLLFVGLNSSPRVDGRGENVGRKASDNCQDNLFDRAFRLGR